jgi:hypothetical protein
VGEYKNGGKKGEKGRVVWKGWDVSGESQNKWELGSDVFQGMDILTVIF